MSLTSEYNYYLSLTAFVGAGRKGFRFINWQNYDCSSSGGVRGSNQNRNLNCFNLTIEPSPAKLICYECEIFCWYETIRSSPGGPLDPSGQHGLTVRPLQGSHWPGGRAILACDWLWRSVRGRGRVGLIFRCW